MNDIFFITGINPDNFKRYTLDNNITHLVEDRNQSALKLEILDHYPNDQPFSDIHHLQGIEKVCMPETDLFIIELKGHHIKPKTNSKQKDDATTYNNEIPNNKTLSILGSELRNFLAGRGLKRRCKDYSNQISMLNSYDIYHFTLTEGTGQRRYLTSLIFFELCLDTKNRRAYLLPMVYSLVSSYPIFKFQKQYLVTLFND